MRRKLAAGNWKMHGTSGALSELGAIAEAAAAHGDDGPEVLVCPPATLISRAADAARGTALAIGGQDCHVRDTGAHTGDISAAMLRDAGASHVILGHSERRADHGETDALVAAKTRAARAAGLAAIVCVGETESQRDAGDTMSVVLGQLDASLPDAATDARPIVAYEPVWAIGTGRTPTPDQIAEVHRALRAALTRRFGRDTADGARLLYGGSVKPGNAAEIFAIRDVDGALVGGASLKSGDFGAIIAALAAA